MKSRKLAKTIPLLITIVFSSLIGFSQVPSYLPTNGLLAWYPFSGNVNDASGNNNNATNNGATLATDRLGNANSAYGFNGSNSYIQLPNLKPPFISISFWFKLNSGQAKQSLIRNRFEGYGIQYNWDFPNDYSGQGANKLCATLWVDTGTTNKRYEHVAQPNVNDGAWHHVAFSYDGMTYKFYLDNVNTFSSSSFGSDSVFYNNSGNGFTIGRDGDFNNYYFNGLIDDVSIFNRALSAQEINSIYTQTALPPCQVTIYDTTYVTIYDTTHVTVFDTVKTFTSVSDTLLIDVTISGLNPPNNINLIKVYPNPANDKLMISIGNYASMLGYTVKITNALGQIVFLSAINQQQYTINLTSWTGNGLYFLTITDPSNNIVETKKIILQ